MEDDGGYASKVMAEYERLRQVASGRAVQTQPPPARPRAIPNAPAGPAMAEPIPVKAPAPATGGSEKVAVLVAPAS
jgi:hypothetical protein